MPLSGPSSPLSSESEPHASPPPAAATVVFDASNKVVRYRRLLGAATLAVAVAWSAGTFRIWKHVGTLALARTLDAYVGELSAGPAPTSQPVAMPDPLSMLFNPFPAPAATPGDAERQIRVKRAGEAALTVEVWAEGVRLAWVVMMGAVALVMLVAAAAGLCGSPKSERLHHALGWLIIAATLGTFVAISLLIEKAGFPSMSSGAYVLITLLHCGYGWILLFTQVAGPSESPEP